jgi:hypothetical protein
MEGLDRAWNPGVYNLQVCYKLLPQTFLRGAQLADASCPIDDERLHNVMAQTSEGMKHLADDSSHIYITFARLIRRGTRLVDVPLLCHMPLSRSRVRWALAAP